jgi:5-methylcytosine-specific restriction endonuclease McrA
MFPSEWKEEFYIEQNKKCDACSKDLTDSREYALSELDHVKSWKNGGLTERNNCRLVCQSCNRKKSSK